MKPRIYMETSVISYLAARPSAEVTNASRQFYSHELWKRRGAWDLLVSEAVVREAAFGDADAARTRLDYCKQLLMVDVRDEADAIAAALMRRKAIPAKAFADAAHIAIASAQAADFIASWNFRHIAGAVSRRKLEIALDAIGAHVPTIATPEEIVENLK